jgi:hypothetical protein
MQEGIPLHISPAAFILQYLLELALHRSVGHHTSAIGYFLLRSSGAYGHINMQGPVLFQERAALAAYLPSRARLEYPGSGHLQK